jgi:hypothetical protein
MAAWGSALLSAMMLFIVCGLLAGAMLFADRFIPAKASAPAAEVAKVGPTFATRGGMAPARTPLAESPRPELKPAAEPVQALAPLPTPAMVATPAAHAPASPSARPAVAALDPATDPSAEPMPAEAAPAARTASADKPAKKLLCTTFRTYDPQSQTYRGFDGQIKPCRQD